MCFCKPKIILTFFSLLFLFLNLSSCATVSYLIDQGIGQWHIQRTGRDNKDILNDPNVSVEIKKKIHEIQKAKRFFSEYFEKDLGGIYSKTTFLDEKAVTWLLIASSPFKVEAHEFNFPFMGSFPYIGFFKKEKAVERAIQLEREKQLVTWIRPVLAYSTLGYFEDRILSSFFEFDEFELVELVFHELFHVLFFSEDSVELNENLAQFVSERLMYDYFVNRRAELDVYLKSLMLDKKFTQSVIRKIPLLERELALCKPPQFQASDKELSKKCTRQKMSSFFKQELISLVDGSCKEVVSGPEKCPNLETDWNQARLAALKTYEEQQDFLTQIYEQNANKDLKLFVKMIQAWEKEWKIAQRKKTDLTFEAYLKNLEIMRVLYL
jgi:predicted aminopeptidase